MIGTVRVEFKASKKGAWGKSPISMIYSVNGDRKRYSPKITIYGIYWDKGNQRLQFIPLKEAKRLLPDVLPNQLLSETECKAINNTLDRFKSEIHDTEVRFTANKTPFTSTMVVDAIINKQAPLTKKEETKGLVFKFMQDWIIRHEKLKPLGSLSVYRSTLEHLKGYQDHTKEIVKFDTIDKDFFIRFYTYLIGRQTKENKAGEIFPLLNDTTMKKITGTLKKFLNEAKSTNKVNDFSGFTIKTDELEVVTLSEEELDILLNLDLSEKLKLDRVRDLFIFSCCTGMRFSDIIELQHANIQSGLIKIRVTKTRSFLTIPLSPLSFKILQKYAGQEYPLPRISNQKANDYLTDVCKLAGFNQVETKVRNRGAETFTTLHPRYERITFHTGRKTFCTISLKRGMKETEVMKISGHRDFRSFQRYINLDDSAIVFMGKAWGELERTPNT